jgi:hypothetical protein
MSRCLAFLLAPLLLAGCGSPDRPFTDNSKDADLYAADVKQIAYSTVSRAKRSREPADQVQVLVTELESQESNNKPAGPHKAVYGDMLAAAKLLLEDCKKANGKPANLNSRLDAIKVIADKLPGQVQPDK